MIKKLALAFLLLAASTICFAEKPIDAAQRIAISIRCDGQPDGTGFAIAPNLVMTAGHVGCSKEEETEISLDHEKTWLIGGHWKFNGELDVAILMLEGAPLKNIVKFRAPKLGEKVYSYGIALGGLLSEGIVAHIDTDNIFSTAIPYSGMSGSAYVGEDGRVVGMVNFGLPDERVSGTVSGGIPGDTLKKLFAGFIDFMKGEK